MAAKRPQKPKRSKTRQQRAVPVSHIYTLHMLNDTARCIHYFHIIFQTVVLLHAIPEVHANGNLYYDRIIVDWSLLQSLYSVMSLIILFSFIASQTLLFI